MARNSIGYIFLNVIVGTRIQDRMDAGGLSQAELARRTGLAQPTIFNLLHRNKIGSKHLHRIARELGTTPEYLTGETDDPDAGAPPPASAPRLQFITMPVALPTEDALADGFEALLMVSEEMDRAELARELARRLPTLLRIAGGAAAVQPSGGVAAPDAAVAAQSRAGRAKQRA